MYFQESLRAPSSNELQPVRKVIGQTAGNGQALIALLETQVYCVSLIGWDQNKNSSWVVRPHRNLLNILALTQAYNMKGISRAHTICMRLFPTPSIPEPPGTIPSLQVTRYTYNSPGNSQARRICIKLLHVQKSIDSQSVAWFGCCVGMVLKFALFSLEHIWLVMIMLRSTLHFSKSQSHTCVPGTRAHTLKVQICDPASTLKLCVIRNA